MKYLIVGLGNPGSDYELTRHNVGFMVLDHLASRQGTTFQVDRLAMRTEIKIKGKTLVLIKPTTFMNLSGKAVRFWLQQLKVDAQQSIVITDDIALPFGTLRLRKKGSSGGHNGLKSIEAEMLTQEFPRLRFGVGNDFAKGKQADYVLSPFTKPEFESLSLHIEKAGDIVLMSILEGFDLAMSKFNQ